MNVPAVTLSPLLSPYTRTAPPGWLLCALAALLAAGAERKYCDYTLSVLSIFIRAVLMLNLHIRYETDTNMNQI